MSDGRGPVVVSGDVAVDWLQWSHFHHQKGSQNWLLNPGFKMAAHPGGALLLAEMVARSTGEKVISQHLEEPDRTDPEVVLHSLARLSVFPESHRGGSRVYRVEHFDGYSGPERGLIRPLPLENDDPSAGLVVLDDAGNGFRNAPDIWPRALRDQGPVVLLKMNRPLGQGRLWERLVEGHRDRLVTVINANSLRAQGLNISRRLSWERTAQDMVWQTRNSPLLHELLRSRHLIVLFGIEGAAHCRRGPDPQVSLFYDPLTMEDDYKDDWPGEMQGLTSAFVAGMAAVLHREGVDSVSEGVDLGLKSSRRLFLHGFGGLLGPPRYPMDRLFQEHPSDPLVNEVPVPGRGDPGVKSPWTILDQLMGHELEEVAQRIVLEGSVPPMIKVPVGRFGNLVTVDREEIESYQSIMNLMDEYLSKDEFTVPLSIAVFGQPGSGKTFGVTQISKSLQPEKIEKMEFNLAQFNSPSDLTNAFHKVQSAGLRGKIPLVFFDEFDCHHGQDMGWLKYFLAPMQEGTFREGESYHPIGKSILVFAGGTSHTFEEFFCDPSEEERDSPGHDWEEFCRAKGPDFVSRLRGYVNIMGINPMGEGDRLYLIRRAMILRSILEDKCPHIFDEGGGARIDPAVLRAMIKVSRYKHGVRSMEAVVEMSLLSGRTEFEAAALPPRTQLELHVDSEDFRRLVMGGP
ncbi:MAG: AAA family ATPase [Methanomassiliicoccales archaeon]